VNAVAERRGQPEPQCAHLDRAHFVRGDLAGQLRKRYNETSGNRIQYGDNALREQKTSSVRSEYRNDICVGSRVSAIKNSAHLEKVINNAIIHVFTQSGGEQKETRPPDINGFRVSARNDTPLPYCFKTVYPTLFLHECLYRALDVIPGRDPESMQTGGLCVRTHVDTNPFVSFDVIFSR
jgi:hypothetical protein